MYDRAGDLAAARERYDALRRLTPPAEDSAAAAYKEASAELRAGDEARGWEEMNAMLLAFPNDGLAKTALHRILSHVDETAGPAASLDFLRRVEPTLASTERAEEVSYETARRLATLGRLAEARDAFVRTAARWRYPDGALWDDSLYRAAEIDRTLGRPDAAIADLDAMLSQQETAILNGSAIRPRYPEAAMLAARIYRDDLHDAARARERFHAAFKRFPDWAERDQALWAEAELWRADGRADEACRTLRVLVSAVPDSRYVPCATVHCAEIARPAGSHSPAACHAYIEGRSPGSDAASSP
jgi:tetratricopeptide (TPR) repeat protein